MKKPRIIKVTVSVIIVLLIVFAVYFLLFKAYTYKNTDASDYGKYDEYTERVLAGNSRKLLPETIAENSIVGYSYERRKPGVFDDAAFSIFLKAKYDESVFAEELNRIGGMSDSMIEVSDGKIQYFSATGELKELRELCDDHVLDGLWYYLEIARFDFENNTVEYCVILLQEGMRMTETAESFINTCLSECSL